MGAPQELGRPGHWTPHGPQGDELFSSWDSILSDSGFDDSKGIWAFSDLEVEEENGWTNDADGWSGTGSDGLWYGSGYDCSGWTSTSGYGVAAEFDFYLLNVEASHACSQELAIVCLRLSP